ncbi:MAG: hypothetical protein AAFR82_06840 [Pseudomonadota bacterium]
MFRISLLLFGAMALTACASVGNLAAVNKKETLGAGFNGNGSAPAGVFIDAEQRAVLSNKRSDSDLRVVCAEPAPDALSAIAAQAGVSVSDISNAVSAEGGVSEAAANIGLRTQTIQTLRDGFYRVCEAYMNGLSEEQYSIMLRRFQTNMIALLAIEQLTGSVKGGDAVVSASAGSGIDYREQYLQRAAMASAEQTRLVTEIQHTNEEIALLEETNNQCYVGGATAGCSANDIERRNRQVLDMRAQARAMERAQASAQATSDINSSLASTAPSATDSSAGGITGSWPSSPAYPPSYAVAEAVRDITMAIVQNDYGVQLCFEHLRTVDATAATALSQHCDEVMGAYVSQLRNNNEMRVEMQRAQAAIMQEVVAGGMSVGEANQLMASVFGIAASSPTTAQSTSELMEPVAMMVVRTPGEPMPPPPPPPTQD